MKLVRRTKSNKKYISLLLLFLMVSLSACSHVKLIKPGDSLKVAYQKSVTMFQGEHYRDAINAFETVINYGRGTQYAKMRNILRLRPISKAVNI